MPSIPLDQDMRHTLLRAFVRHAVQRAFETIASDETEYAKEHIAVFGSKPRLDETDELVLITAGYELADRLYAKSTRR